MNALPRVAHGGSAGGYRITHPPSGQPTLELRRAAGEHATRMGVRRICTSIIHSGNMAFAEVIF
jgi:phosphopantetheinyl transferase (holo-ACP synthase)